MVHRVLYGQGQSLKQVGQVLGWHHMVNEYFLTTEICVVISPLFTLPKCVLGIINIRSKGNLQPPLSRPPFFFFFSHDKSLDDMFVCFSLRMERARETLEI